jgi:hypothetical protein
MTHLPSHFSHDRPGWLSLAVCDTLLNLDDAWPLSYFVGGSISSCGTRRFSELQLQQLYSQGIRKDLILIPLLLLTIRLR